MSQTAAMGGMSGEGLMDVNRMDERLQYVDNANGENLYGQVHNQLDSIQLRQQPEDNHQFPTHQSQHTELVDQII